MREAEKGGKRRRDDGDGPDFIKERTPGEISFPRALTRPLLLHDLAEFASIVSEFSDWEVQTLKHRHKQITKRPFLARLDVLAMSNSEIFTPCQYGWVVASIMRAAGSAAEHRKRTI